ncbi:hypothetical protein BGP76_00160 [Reichenbachiella sp. MSK19-1]|nr:hypothetical protein BGP76_00160 [Reichenbachiella sp. MSK19-1]
MDMRLTNNQLSNPPKEKREGNNGDVGASKQDGFQNRPDGGNANYSWSQYHRNIRSGVSQYDQVLEG